LGSFLAFLFGLPVAALQLCVLQLQACTGLPTEPIAAAAAAALGSFLSKLPAAAPQLCVLDLSDCWGLLTRSTAAATAAAAAAAASAGSFLSKLPVAAPQLRVLELSDCRGLPGAAIAGLLQQLHSLSRVKLDGIPEVRGAAALCVCMSGFFLHLQEWRPPAGTGVAALCIGRSDFNLHSQEWLHPAFAVVAYPAFASVASPCIRSCCAAGRVLQRVKHLPLLLLLLLFSMSLLSEDRLMLPRCQLLGAACISMNKRSCVASAAAAAAQVYAAVMSAAWPLPASA
jgi:hypothetical protein